MPDDVSMSMLRGRTLGPAGSYKGVDELGRPLGEHEPDTWSGGFVKGLKDYFLPSAQDLQAMTEAATIRPRGSRMEDLAQIAPYLLPTTIGAAPEMGQLAGQVVRDERLRPYAAKSTSRIPAQTDAMDVAQAYYRNQKGTGAVPPGAQAVSEMGPGAYSVESAPIKPPRPPKAGDELVKNLRESIDRSDAARARRAAKNAADAPESGRITTRLPKLRQWD